MMVPVFPHYFQTMGGRILYGREFNDAEVPGITVPDTPEAILYYRLAGANCAGEGPR